VACNSKLPNLESVSDLFLVSGPAVRDYELAGRFIPEQHRGATVAKGLFDVGNDLFQKDRKVQHRIDPLRNTVKQKKVLRLRT